MKLFLLIMTGVFLGSCGEKPHEEFSEEQVGKAVMKQSRICYTRGDDGGILSAEEHANRLSELLDKQQIPHVLHKEKACLEYDPKFEAVVSEQQLYVGGEPPFAGLSTSWVGRNDQLIELLESHGIKVRKHMYYGSESVSWLYEDYEKVESILEFTPKRKKLFEELRASDPRVQLMIEESRSGSQ